MDLATESLPERAPKARSNNAWGEFLRRVLVSSSFDDGARTAAGTEVGPLPPPDAESGLQERLPAKS